MALLSVTNINHWLVSWPSIVTTQPLAILIPVAITVCGLFLTLGTSRFRSGTAKNDRKYLWFYPILAVIINLNLNTLKAVELPIIQRNTQYVIIRNKRLRIVHIIHELGAKVPLVVFIHGLGGQVRYIILRIVQPNYKLLIIFTFKIKGDTMGKSNRIFFIDR